MPRSMGKMMRAMGKVDEVVPLVNAYGTSAQRTLQQP
jgi:hypothetical protein